MKKNFGSLALCMLAIVSLSSCSKWDYKYAHHHKIKKKTHNEQKSYGWLYSRLNEKHAGVYDFYVIKTRPDGKKIAFYPNRVDHTSHGDPVNPHRDWLDCNDIAYYKICGNLERQRDGAVKGDGL